MRQETYSYGQGRVLVAHRLPNGQPGPFRWVGDVSELSIALNVEDFTHKESYSGNRLEVRKIITSKSGELTCKFHEMSTENLSLMLLGKTHLTEAGEASEITLPETIAADDVISLPHQNISNVKIPTLTENTDFVVDSTFGTITFLKPQQSFTKKASYHYGAVSSVALLNDQPVDLFLRFEGVNLAEKNEWNLVELYKVNFNPTDALSLINNDNNLDALTGKAKILADTTKVANDALGRFGRMVKIKK